VIVKVININPKEGHEVLERCQVLKEYGLFIDTIRKLQGEGNPEPFKDAIEQCIRLGILSDYLRKRGSEVFNMLIAKYDYETDIKVQRQEAREEGEVNGIEKALKSLIDNTDWTIEQAMKMLEIPEEEQSLYREKLKK
jgi:hypothetical protein